MKKNISIQKEEIMLTWKDLIIAFLFSLLLSITLYASNILKEFNFLIISIVFLISVTGYIIVFAILKSQYDKKHIGTLKQTLKILYPFFHNFLYII